MSMFLEDNYQGSMGLNHRICYKKTTIVSFWPDNSAMPCVHHLSHSDAPEIELFTFFLKLLVGVGLERDIWTLAPMINFDFLRRSI